MCNPKALVPPRGEAASSAKHEHEAYGKRGDVIHVLTLINTIAFCFCVLFYKDSALFDSTWAKEGFCVSNRDVHYWNSHDLSFYADTALSIVSAITYLALRKKDGMGPANAYMLPNTLGVLFHGFAHGGLGAAIRGETHGELLAEDASYLSTVGDKTWGTIARELSGREALPILLFWLVLLRAVMPDSPKRISAPLSLMAWIGQLSMSPTMGFTYTQTVLLLSFSIDQLGRAREEKGYAYAAYAAIVSAGVPLVGWLESTACSSLVIHLGGHLIYDGFIAVAGLAFYLHYYANRVSETAKIKAE